MPYEPPGLTRKPAEEALVGFESLMPEEENDQKRGLLGRIVRLPFKIIALPLKAIAWILRLPVRALRRNKSGDAGDDADA